MPFRFILLFFITILPGWKKPANVLLIGLENAGKTTFLHLLSDGCEELTLDGLRIVAYDLGGCGKTPRVWRPYLPTIDGIVFIVDSTDVQRFKDARSELDCLLHDDMVASVPVVVLANKIDRRDAVGEDEMSTSLGIGMYRTGKELTEKEKIPSRPVELFPSSIVKRLGYGEAFRWLKHYIKQGNTTHTNN